MDYLEGYLGQVSWEGMISTSLRILLVLVGLWLLSSLVRSALKRLEQRLLKSASGAGELPSEAQKRAETLVRLLRQGVIIMLWVVGLLIILRELGLDITPILASAGILGLAVGFGAQNLVRDVISGFFLIMENQVRVGDVAVVNGTGGLVEAVNFRTIVLRDLSGTVHVFPNGTITTLANLTQEWSAYVFDIGVAYKEDVDQVMALMREVGAELQSDDYFGPLMVDKLEVFGVDAFADSAVVIKGRLRTLPIKQWEVGRE
ncbi:MAG: mechanosensitive ion channel family protein, partial [Gammaproteobacteria bacterium]|nr:mechanosensitive ion channel family protein [Gammaproteobacteria bacterium]